MWSRLTSYGANAAAELCSLPNPDPEKVQQAAGFYRQNLQSSQNEAIANLALQQDSADSVRELFNH